MDVGHGKIRFQLSPLRRAQLNVMGYFSTKEAFSTGWREQNVEWRRWKGLSEQIREILEQGSSKCCPQGDTRSYKPPTETERKHLKPLEHFDRMTVCLLNLKGTF